MRKIALLLSFLLLFSACNKSEQTSEQPKARIVVASTSSSEDSSAESSVDESLDNKKNAKEVNESATSEVTATTASASEVAAQAASEAAASQAAAQAASEAAASQAAAQAAAEAAASQAAAQAASEAAASQAAAQAASEAAASEAAAQAASEAAASEAAASKAAAKKAASKKVSLSGKNFLPTVEQEVLKLQNEERAQKGLSALQYDADLTAAARIRSKELCQAGMFAHTRTDGREWNTVIIEDVPFEYKSAGENLGMAEYNDPNQDLANDAQFWVDSWVDSPTHYKNMMRSEYNRAGVGIYCVERDGMIYAYATTIFASI